VAVGESGDRRSQFRRRFGELREKQGAILCTERVFEVKASDRITNVVVGRHFSNVSMSENTIGIASVVSERRTCLRDSVAEWVKICAIRGRLGKGEARQYGADLLNVGRSTRYRALSAG